MGYDLFMNIMSYDSSAHPIKPRYVSHKRLEVPWDGYLLSFPSTKLLRHEFNAKI